MNLKQAARRLGIHYQTAYKLVRSGRLAAVRVGGSYEISDAAVDRYLAEREAMYRVPLPAEPPVPGAASEIDVAGRTAPGRSAVDGVVATVRRALDATLTTARPVLEIAAEGLSTTLGDLAIIRPVSEDRQWLLPGVVHHRDVGIRCIVAAAAEHFPQALPSRAMGDGKVGETVFVPHVPQDRVRADMPAELVQHLDATGVHSLVSVPAVADGEVLGVVTVTRDAPGRPYTRDDVDAVTNVADVVGRALARARAASHTWRRRRTLARALVDVLERGDGLNDVPGLLLDHGVAELVCDTGGRILAAGKCAESLFGRPRAELVGLPFTDLLVPAEADDERRATERLVRGELTFLDGTRTLRDRQRGGSGPAEIHVARGVVRDAAAEPRAIVVFAYAFGGAADTGVGRALEPGLWSERAGRRRAS